MRKPQQQHSGSREKIDSLHFHFPPSPRTLQEVQIHSRPWRHIDAVTLEQGAKAEPRAPRRAPRPKSSAFIVHYGMTTAAGAVETVEAQLVAC